MENGERLGELHARRAIARAAVQLLADEKNDLRAADALREYQAQLARIDAQIAEIEGKPPAVVVGLRTASLSARASTNGERINE